MNICIFTGNLVADPEVRTTSSGTKITSFRMAVRDPFAKEDKTPFIDLEAWEKKGELIAEYFKKGSLISVNASARLDQWTDKATGQRRSKVYFRVNDFEFGGGKKAEQDGSGETAPELESSIPF